MSMMYEEKIDFEGFVLMWSGWIQEPTTDKLVGRWLAAKDIGIGIDWHEAYYSSYPGNVGKFTQGMHFDLTRFPEQFIVHANFSDIIRNSAKEWALEKLKFYIKHREFGD